MSSLLPLVCSSLLAWPAEVETKFVQVHPAPPLAHGLERSRGQERAVVLIHGLRPQFRDDTRYRQALFQTWQQPDSTCVRALGEVADVYAFAYGQHTPVEDVAQVAALGEYVGWLELLGYRDIVLLGHSAGGLIARLFVEDNPDARVTKVIQVCSPNGGSTLADLVFGLRQKVFLDSLTRDSRRRCCLERAGRRIPEHVEFVCVVGNGLRNSDGIVSCRCQWSEDLQEQCIPVVPLTTTHFSVMRSSAVAERLAELVRQPQPRWPSQRVAEARRTVLRD